MNRTGADTWQTTRLGDVLTLQRGYDIRKVDLRDGSVPVVSSGGVYGYHDTPIAEGPGVVIPRTGTLGTAYYIESDYWPHNTTLFVRDFKGNQPRFVHYFLRGFAVVHLNVGSAHPTLNRNHLHPLSVRWPSLPEQKAIAHVLGTLDDKIELNRRMNETLEEMARAIFKSWFVDFDPVKAKMDGRKPCGMDDETAALFPDSFEDSAIGRIPRGWAARVVTDVIDVNPRRPLRKGDVAPYVEMKHMPERGHRPSSWPCREFRSGTRFTNGDTLVARITPCLENGKTAYVDFLDDGSIAWGSTEYIVLRPRQPLTPMYAYFLARSPDFRAYMIANMTGSSGRQRVPASCLESYTVAPPPAGVTTKFDGTVAPMIRRVAANHDENVTLAGLRDALLPKLISGELDVRELTDLPIETA
jgi:type I restriction enzyme, S subunit